MTETTTLDDSATVDTRLDPNAVYQSLVARRISYDQMMWQAPTLSITAQSFLVTVGVNGDLAVAVRVLALVMAATSGVLSMQLMAKQRIHEQVDSKYLQEWESASRVRPVAGYAPHDRAIEPNGRPGKAEALGLRPGWWVRRSSYQQWMWGLRLYFAATVGLLVWVLATAR